MSRLKFTHQDRYLKIDYLANSAKIVNKKNLKLRIFALTTSATNICEAKKIMYLFATVSPLNERYKKIRFFQY